MNWALVRRSRQHSPCPRFLPLPHSLPIPLALSCTLVYLGLGEEVSSLVEKRGLLVGLALEGRHLGQQQSPLVEVLTNVLEKLTLLYAYKNQSNSRGFTKRRQGAFRKALGKPMMIRILQR